MFLTLYEEMKEILECNYISLESSTPIPVFAAEHQWKTENWITNGTELDFFNTTIQQKQYYYASGLLLSSFVEWFILSAYYTSSAELDFW